MGEYVFGTWLKDVAGVLTFGAAGGLALGLMQDKGLELPSIVSENGKKFLDPGFFADIGIGAIAALVIYGFNPPSTVGQLMATSITAGVGGSGVLKSYVRGIGIRKHAEIAGRYRELLHRAAKGEDASTLSSQMEEIKKEEERVRRRWGVG